MTMEYSNQIQIFLNRRFSTPRLDVRDAKQTLNVFLGVKKGMTSIRRGWFSFKDRENEVILGW